MIEAVLNFAEDSRQTVDALSDGTFDDHQRRRYLESWREFSVARGAALLAGPKQLTSPLRDMARDAAEYSNLVDTWISDTNNRPEGLQHSEVASEKSRIAYIDAARQHLALDD